LLSDLEFNSSLDKSDKKSSLAAIKKEMALRKLSLDQILDSSLHLVQRSSAQVSLTFALYGDQEFFSTSFR
jgi:hypothetical protein